jgi:hypothetical protein
MKLEPQAAGLAFAILLNGCTPGGAWSTYAPPRARIADSQQQAHSRHVLERHHWRITMKNHDVKEFTGVAVVKRFGNSRMLELRAGDEESQVDVGEVASAEKVGERSSRGTGRNTSFITACIDTDSCVDGDAIPSDLGCDPSVSFCCPVRNAFGTSVPCGNVPELPDGIGCEFDETCGDDGFGNAFGVALIPFATRYCWYDFVNYDISCFLGAIPFFGHGENLFRSWHNDAPASAVLLCNPPLNGGWGFANYEDDGNTPKRVGFEKKHVLGRDTAPGSIISWAYPSDFLFGRADVTSQAKLESRYYHLQVPINLPGNQMGYCNSDGVQY